jgi:hypothetical protein
VAARAGDVAVLPRRRFHRAVFLAAGVYNIAWGIHAVLNPQWLFRLTGMPDAIYPELFACAGMVIGLYGVLYLEVARVPEAGWVPAAVGFAGKVFGPAGWLVIVLAGAWPPRTAILVLTNDVIWWVPFVLYLRDAWPGFRSGVSGLTPAGEAGSTPDVAVTDDARPRTPA